MAGARAAAQSLRTIVIVQGDCGQSTCAPADCKWPEKFGGFKEGTCASVGYTVADGQQIVKVPIIGIKQTYDLFKKASDVTALLDGNTTIYKIGYPKKVLITCCCAVDGLFAPCL